MHKLVAIAIALVTACGSDSVSLDDTPAAFREALCRYFVKCGAVEDAATCAKANLGVSFRVTASLQAEIDMGLVVYDSEIAKACFDAIGALRCDQPGRGLPEACNDVFVGTQHDGQACAQSSECISRFCDVPACDQACCTGTCRGDLPPVRAKLGESCEAGSCEANAYCDDAITMCVALKPSGAFCTSPAECDFGLDCDPSGTCTSLPTLGQSCDGRCRDFGTTCSATTGTCVEVGLAGDPCTTSEECSQIYTCDETKHCSPGIALGQPCTPSQRCAGADAFCEVPDGQLTGTCALPNPDGAACQRDAHCQSHSCDDATRLCGPEPVCI